ncbi:hypothetical protein [Frankia sp. CcI49]|uniref:hypothetical protein n=1 Tax=Frankia sp. CcI49 TaxID=1745382 RepID=UPI0018EA0A9B|nr:hypothetical protein [Frankia sp. CcI49]
MSVPTDHGDPGLASGAAHSVDGMGVDNGAMPDDESRPVWPTNAAGETYGSAVPAVKLGLPQSDWPDLISAGLRDGKRGYIRRTEMEAARGTYLTPAEFAEFSKKAAARRAAGERTLIPVYEQDGVTVIGTFVMGSAPTAEPARPASPGRPGGVRRAAAPASDAPVAWFLGAEPDRMTGPHPDTDNTND